MLVYGIGPWRGAVLAGEVENWMCDKLPSVYMMWQRLMLW